MKNFFFIMLLLGAITTITFSSCDQEDGTVINLNETPGFVQAYVDFHFPNNAIVQTVKEIEQGTVTFEVALQGNIQLEFNEAGEIIEIDATSQLPDSVLQPAILTYVQDNYPDNVVTDWELVNNEQQIEFNNSVELVFNLNGDFLRVDN